MDRHESNSHAAGSALQSVVGSCALLAVIIAPVAVVIAGICNGGLGRDSVWAAAIAGMVCWTAGAGALSITAVATQFKAPVQGVLLAMLFRMGLPLAALMAFTQVEHPVVAAGLAPTTLGVYLVTLVAETLLTVRMVPATGATKAV